MHIGQRAAKEALADGLETDLSAGLARLEAAASRYRLLLDAHPLWPLDVDEEGEGHAHYRVPRMTSPKVG